MNFLETQKILWGHDQRYPKSVTVIHFEFNCKFFLTLIGRKNCQSLRMQNITYLLFQRCLGKKV